MRSRLGRPSPSLVISIVALFVAMGGTSYAAITITGKNIKDGSVTGKDVKNASLGGSDIKDKSLKASDFSGSVAGPAGAKGATGATGPQGLQGPRGFAGFDGTDGSPGLSEVERVVKTVATSSNSSKSTTADCPDGKKVIGGGVRLVSGEGDVVIDEGYPDTDTRFYGESRSVTGGAVSHGLIVTAICAFTD